MFNGVSEADNEGFYLCIKLNDIDYYGTLDDRNKMLVKKNNSSLIYFALNPIKIEDNYRYFTEVNIKLIPIKTVINKVDDDTTTTDTTTSTNKNFISVDGI